MVEDLPAFAAGAPPADAAAVFAACGVVVCAEALTYVLSASPDEDEDEDGGGADRRCAVRALAPHVCHAHACWRADSLACLQAAAALVRAGAADDAAALAASAAWAPGGAAAAALPPAVAAAHGGAIRAASLALLLHLQQCLVSPDAPAALRDAAAVRARLYPLALRAALDALGCSDATAAASAPGAARARGVAAALLSVAVADIPLKRAALDAGALPALVSVAADAATFDPRTRGRGLAGAGNIAYVAASADVAGFAALLAHIRDALVSAADALPSLAARQMGRPRGRDASAEVPWGDDDDVERSADEVQRVYNAAFAALQLARYREPRGVLGGADVRAALHKILAAAARGGGGGERARAALAGFVPLLQTQLLPALDAEPIGPLGCLTFGGSSSSAGSPALAAVAALYGGALPTGPVPVARGLDPGGRGAAAFTPASRDAPMPGASREDTRALLRAVCAGCGALDAGSAMRKCSRCLGARYCGAECQRAHWKVHKKTCAPPSTS